MRGGGSSANVTFLLDFLDRKRAAPAAAASFSARHCCCPLVFAEPGARIVRAIQGRTSYGITYVLRTSGRCSPVRLPSSSERNLTSTGGKFFLSQVGHRQVMDEVVRVVHGSRRVRRVGEGGVRVVYVVYAYVPTYAYMCRYTMVWCGVVWCGAV